MKWSGHLLDILLDGDLTLIKMAGDEVALFYFGEGRPDLITGGESFRAAGVKAAPQRWVNGTGDIAGDRFSLLHGMRVGDRNRRKKNLRIRMFRGTV
jgi:hypothetical protein